MDKPYFNSLYVTELSPQDFDKTNTYKLKDKECAVVLFFKRECPYCIAMKDEYEKFGKIAGYINIYAFDAEKHREHILKIREELPELVKGYPTIIMYKNGQPQEQYMSGDRKAQKFLDFSMRLCGEKFDKKKKVVKLKK